MPSLHDEPSPPLLQLKKISKSFPGVCALANVDLTVNAGEVVGLIGENGAGKSTLAKIIGGIEMADGGQFIWEGREIRAHNVAHAQNLGIAIIHQELNLVPHLSVEANLFLGREPCHWGLLHRAALRRDARAALAKVGLEIPPDLRVEELPIATRQLIEIAKALSYNARLTPTGRSGLIVMDEPTSALSQRETRHLFGLIRALKQKGFSVLFISHQLDQVLEICDRISVLRDGQNAGDVVDSDRHRAVLERMMVGRHIQLFAHKQQAAPGPVAFEVKNFLCETLVAPVSFQIHEGEILGLAGLIGSGRTKLIRSIFGADPRLQGEIFLQGRSLIISSPRDAIRAGIGFVPEDRKEQGLILKMAVSANIAMAGIGLHSRFGWLNRHWEWTTAQQFVARLRIKTSSLTQPVDTLSGGNQQKMVLAKWLALNPKILILDEPTRGVDVGAKAELHALIAEMATRGMAILLVSSEMEEIIGLADRVIVMNQGQFAGEIVREEMSEEKIMALAAHRAANAVAVYDRRNSANDEISGHRPPQPN